MNNYTLIKNFLDPSVIEQYISGTKRVIRRFYDPHHLSEHSAYFSDQSENRESYAFSVWNGQEPCTLPAISSAIIAESSRNLASMNLKIMEHLGVSDQTRLMFNVQMYRGNCKPVPKHFDGEYFNFEVQENGDLLVNNGLRPEKVAVLVLVNDSDSGGTRLHFPDGTSEVVVGQAGDLLVFSNAKLLHSVDSLIGTVKRDDGLLRMTIGWRSLEENTQLIYEGEQRERVGTETARRLHRDYLDAEWKRVYDRFVRDGKLPAF